MRDWLLQIRSKRGLSQQQTADKAGISQSYYASIETGGRGRKLPQPTAAKIAAALDFEWTRFYRDRGPYKHNKKDYHAGRSSK